MRRIFASLLTLGSLTSLFWFNAFPGAEQYFTTFCANPDASFASSGNAGFTPSNGNPKLKLCTIVATEPGEALQQQALN